MSTTPSMLDLASLWRPNIPLLGSEDRKKDTASTPEWMIHMDDLLTSTSKGYEKYTELFGWFSEQTRKTKGASTGELMSSSTVQHANVMVIIPNGIYAPQIDIMLQTGTCMKSIEVVRLGNITNKKVLLQQVVYTNNQIVMIEQRADDLIVAFRPTKRSNRVIQYDQESGDPKGNVVTEFDYTTAE